MCFADAALASDFVTGKGHTGILHTIGGTLIDWCSKHQATVEMSSYSAETVAGRIAVDQIIVVRNALRSIGIPILVESYLFGDKKGVIQNATNPEAQCKKKHNALAFHRTREAVAASISLPTKIDSEDNYTDIFTKPIASTPFIGHVHEMMFRPGQATQADDD